MEDTPGHTPQAAARVRNRMWDRLFEGDKPGRPGPGRKGGGKRGLGHGWGRLNIDNGRLSADLKPERVRRRQNPVSPPTAPSSLENADSAGKLGAGVGGGGSGRKPLAAGGGSTCEADTPGNVLSQGCPEAEPPVQTWGPRLSWSAG